jgi:hypothetical protein
MPRDLTSELYGGGNAPQQPPQAKAAGRDLSAELYGGKPKSWADRIAGGNEYLDDYTRVPADLLEGAVSGIAQTVFNGGDLIRRGLGMQRIIDNPDVKQAMRTPDSTAGAAGHMIEQGAEFIAPVGIATKAVKGAPLAARLATEAAAAAGVTGVQTGGDVSAMAHTAATVGVLGSLGAGVRAGYRGLLKGGSKEALTADMLRKSGAEEYARVLNPTTKGNKARTAKIVPELIDRGVTAFTRQGLADRAAAELETTGAALDKAWAELPQGAAIGLKPIQDRILTTAHEELTEVAAHGGRIAMSDEAETALKHAKNIVDRLAKFAVENPETGEMEIPATVARSVRQHFDKLSKGRFENAAQSIEAANNASAADAIRNGLAEAFPDIAAINKEYAFWADTGRVINDTLLRKQGQSPSLARQILSGAGAAGGMVAGGIKGAVMGAKAMHTLEEITQSPAWRTVGAVWKDRLADAIIKRQRGPAEFAISKLAARVRKAEPELAAAKPAAIAAPAEAITIPPPAAAAEAAPAAVTAEAAAAAAPEPDPRQFSMFPEMEAEAAAAPQAAAAAESAAPGAAPGAQPGGRFADDPSVVVLPTGEIHADPVRFQFKMDTGGKAGTGEELKGVQKWDKELAGVTSVWKDPKNGKTYIVNGHHRLELADRLKVPNLLARYIEAPTAAEARAKGALINITEGRGTPLDAAKLFRDTGLTPEKLEARGISLKGPIARQGAALSNLSPRVFADVMSGELKPERASIIGEALTKHEDQHAVMELLDRAERGKQRVTDDELRELVRRVTGAEKTVETQESLFGSQSHERNHALEEARLSAYVKDRLSREKRLFGSVSKKTAADELGGAGNVLDTDKNARIATDAAQAQEVYDKLSLRAGPINDAIKEATRRTVKGDPQTPVRHNLYETIRKEIAAMIKGETTAAEAAPAAAKPTAAAAPAAPAAAAAPKPEIDLSGMGDAMTGNLYDALAKKLTAGVLTENGKPSAFLKAAAEKGIKTADALRRFAQEEYFVKPAAAKPVTLGSIGETASASVRASDVNPPMKLSSSSSPIKALRPGTKAYNAHIEEVSNALRNKTREVPVEDILAVAPDDARSLRFYWERATGKQIEPYVLQTGPSGFEKIHPTSLGEAFDPDGYLYHVTTEKNASAILKTGLAPGKPASMSNYAEYSKGKAFLTDRDGVSFWRERIEAHARHGSDKEPKLAILRIPREAAGELLADTVGSKDAGAKAFYSEKPIRAAKPGTLGSIGKP